MEFLAIFLSSLITLVSPVGLVLDRTAQGAIRSRFAKVEQLQVRVDNAPTHQLLQGKVERVRLAGRGLFPIKEFRIDTLEVETDPLDLDLNRLRRSRSSKSSLPLDQPVQAGVRLVLKQDDLNQALRSPLVTTQLRNLSLSLLKASEARQVRRYDFLNPRVTFLGNNRVQLQIELQERGYPDTLAIQVETGLAVIAGHQLQLVEPTILLNGKPAPERLVRAIAAGFPERMDLKRLETSGITARVLQFQVEGNCLNLATFVQVRPTRP